MKDVVLEGPYWPEPISVLTCFRSSNGFVTVVLSGWRPDNTTQPRSPRLFGKRSELKRPSTLSRPRRNLFAWPWRPDTVRLLITALALPLGLWLIQYVLQLVIGP